jgi:hypothetical protein
MDAEKAKAMLAALEGIDPMSVGEPIKGNAYRTDGWVYRDVDRTTPALWDELMGILGIENVVVLTMLTGTSAGGPWVRGQIFVSREGQRRASAFVAQRLNDRMEEEKGTKP